MVMGVVNVEMSVEMRVEMVMLKKLDFAGIPFNTKLPSPHPIPNQSKPIVPTPSFSPITSRYTIIISSSSIITFNYIFITISYNL